MPVSKVTIRVIPAILFIAAGPSGCAGDIEGEREDDGVQTLTREIRFGSTVSGSENPRVAALYHMDECATANPFCPVPGEMYWFPRPCSASILRSTVGETWLLTARHCVEIGESQYHVVTPGQLRVNTSLSPGLAQPEPPAGSLTPNLVVPAAINAHSHDITSYDLALVRVGAALPVSSVRISIPVFQSASVEGELLVAYGYGRNLLGLDKLQEDGSSGAGVLRKAAGLPVLSECPFFFRSCGPFGLYTYFDENSLSQGVVNGDSGGPSFRQSSLSTPFMELVGVHSTAVFGEEGADSMLVGAANWIQTQIGHLYLSTHGHPDENLAVNDPVQTGARVNTTTTKDLPGSRWVWDSISRRIWTRSPGGQRLFLTATSLASGLIYRPAFVTPQPVAGGYQQWLVEPDHRIRNDGPGTTGNGEVLFRSATGDVVVGPPPGDSSMIWRFHTQP